jgi:hypothetical protein
LSLRRIAESSAADFTVGKIQKNRGQRVAKTYGQQKRNIIHTSSTAYEQDHSAARGLGRTRAAAAAMSFVLFEFYRQSASQTQAEAL